MSMNPGFRQIPRCLFHISPASAIVVLLASLLFLILDFFR